MEWWIFSNVFHIWFINCIKMKCKTSKTNFHGFKLGWHYGTVSLKFCYIDSVLKRLLNSFLNYVGMVSWLLISKLWTDKNCKVGSWSRLKKKQYSLRLRTISQGMITWLISNTPKSPILSFPPHPGNGVGTLLGGVIYHLYGARNLFRGSAVLCMATLIFYWPVSAYLDRLDEVRERQIQYEEIWCFLDKTDA